MMPKFLMRVVYKSYRDVIIEADDINKALSMDGKILNEDETDLVYYDTVSAEEIDK